VRSKLRLIGSVRSKLPIMLSVRSKRSISRGNAQHLPRLITAVRILDIRTLFHQMLSRIVSIQSIHAVEDSIKHTAKIYTYPCGIMDIVASSNPDFGAKGWEASEDYSHPKSLPISVQRSDDGPKEERRPGAALEDINRSMRRAKAKLRRIALSNDFKYFVTLTIDPSKVDSKDAAAVVKKVNAWCSNAVQRYGLKYIIVPERHKKGGIHFHGFFNDALHVVDSGTLRLPWSKRPRKPKNENQRSEWIADGGQIVYNLPEWTIGFSTALLLHGNYPAAVAYVCKYIGKDGQKPAGRWYYSGGDLCEPKTTYAELSPEELKQDFEEKCWTGYVPGRTIAVVNGINVHGQVQEEDL
jgi:hypothetical protein